MYPWSAALSDSLEGYLSIVQPLRGIAVQLLRVSTPPLVGWQEGGKLGGYGLVV